MVEPLNPLTSSVTPLGWEETSGEYNPASLEEAARKQQKTIIPVRQDAQKNPFFLAGVQTAGLEAATAFLEIKKTSELGEIDETAFSEILGEMKEILRKEVTMFGKALEKSLAESLQNKLKTLENRLIKKMITDIFNPSEENPEPNP